MSFSQNGEDVRMLEVAARTDPGVMTRKGRILEVGAFDAKALSNSRFFIERGWEAVLVEPSPGPLSKLAREYGETISSDGTRARCFASDRVKVVSAAVVPYRDLGTLCLAVTDDAVSTNSSKIFDVWKRKAGYYGSIYVATIGVRELVEQFGPFDLVSIDTEGSSVDLFGAFVDHCFFATAYCVEHDGRISDLMRHANVHGYELAFDNGTNAILRMDPSKLMSGV